MSTKAMEGHLFNLKFSVKQLNKEATRCDRAERAEKAKLKKAIQGNGMELAHIHAENSIRQKNQALYLRQMAARVEAVASRVQSAVIQKKVTHSMAGVVRSMDATLRSMNLERISALMDRFEHDFEELDVQTGVMQEGIASSTAQYTPADAVSGLMQEVADEAGIDLKMQLPSGIPSALVGSAKSGEQDELSARLAKLRAEE